MRNTAKIAAACRSTDKIVQLWNIAEGQLSRCMTNGAGVLAEPHDARARLADAKKAIDDALKVLAATDWPTDTDYDE